MRLEVPRRKTHMWSLDSNPHGNRTQDGGSRACSEKLLELLSTHGKAPHAPFRRKNVKFTALNKYKNSLFV